MIIKEFDEDNLTIENDRGHTFVISFKDRELLIHFIQKEKMVHLDDFYGTKRK